LQCRNKIKKLIDEIQIEQRNQNQHHESRQQLEERLMSEVDRLQADINYAIHASDSTVKTADGLKKEVMTIERDIVEKKNQLEKLVHEMKEVNLQSLTVTTNEEILVGDGKLGRRTYVHLKVIFLLKQKQEDALLALHDNLKICQQLLKIHMAFGFKTTLVKLITLPSLVT
jgi:seryl-tRNA synthetase